MGLFVLKESTEYEQAKEIYDSLTPEQKKLSGINHYVDSERLLERVMYKYGKNPIGFCDAYKYSNSTSKVFLLIVVKPDYQGKGIASFLLKKMFIKLKSKNIDTIIWECEKLNESSYQLALKNGFKLKRQTKTQYILEKQII